MAKKKEQNKTEVVSINTNTRSIIITFICVIVCLILFYLLTLLIINKSASDDSNKVDNKDVVVQHDEIVIGRSFNVQKGEYLVAYFESDDNDISSAVLSYRYSENALNIYTVDMKDAMNSSFSKEESNRDATKASELAINGVTLIKFVDGNISEYIEGKDDVLDYLNN